MSNDVGRGAAAFDRHYGGSEGSSGKSSGDPRVYSELDSKSFSTCNQQVSGSTRVEHLSVEDFHSSGSVSVSGGARVGSFQCSGSASIGGDLVSNSVRTSGSLRVQGKGVVADMSVSGSATLEGGIHVRDNLHANGSLKVPWINSTGRIGIAGRLETGEVGCKEFELSGGGSATTISAASIAINEMTMQGFGKFVGVHFGSRHKPFVAESLISEGPVSMDLCEVKQVKGDIVRIGKRCHVGRVTYRTRCEVEPGASLDEPPVKVSG